MKNDNNELSTVKKYLDYVDILPFNSIIMHFKINLPDLLCDLSERIFTFKMLFNIQSYFVLLF